MSDDHNQQIFADLQAEIAFQGEALRELNDALALQQQDLLLCRRQIALLSDQLRAVRESTANSAGEAAPDDARPPHY